MPAIVLGIQRQPGYEHGETCRLHFEHYCPGCAARFPASVNLDILYDRSQSIRESVKDVQATLAIALGLVVLVIFLFLRNASATIVTSRGPADIDYRHLRRHVSARLYAWITCR